jgi:integrase
LGLKTVAEQLGHSTIQVTADVYAHVTPATLSHAADAVGAAIFGASERASGDAR